MLSPALAAGMLLAFTLAIEEYGVSRGAGLPGRSGDADRRDRKKLADWPIDLNGASLLSLLLIRRRAAAWWLQRRLVGDKEVTSVTGKPGENSGATAGWFTLPALLLMATGRRAGGGAAGGIDGGDQPDGHRCRAGSARIILPLTTLLRCLTTGRCAFGAGDQPFAGAGLGADRWPAGAAAAWLVLIQKIRGSAIIDALSLMRRRCPAWWSGVGLILLWNRPFWPVFAV
ncbi:Uncharacterised protein [Raoultella terrigena]|uniref:Uncharacterized protein n=1 Tax=Raoultella terrigena TaxID=577 RepID=A0A3P8IZ65_RAOTE|nr:Uncharacterised protein [Raoultella terrigena]